MTFAEKLEAILEARNMKSCELAELSELTPAAVSKILSGKNEPRWPSVQKIIKVFPDVDLRYWLDEHLCEKKDKAVASQLRKLSKMKHIFSPEMTETFESAAKIIANK
jgi:transcriptional regulator with XRE-family HTH domain